MNNIMKKAKEVLNYHHVLYAGKHYISIPETESNLRNVLILLERNEYIVICMIKWVYSYIKMITTIKVSEEIHGISFRQNQR